MEPGFGGYIDFWGDLGDPSRSVACGWIAQPFKDLLIAGELAVKVRLTDSEVQTTALGMAFTRADVAAIGTGAILICNVPASVLEGVAAIDIQFGTRVCRLRSAPGTRRLDAGTLRDALGPLLARAVPVDHRAIALACLNMGEDGYGAATGDATIQATHVFNCSPAGALILGVLTAAEPAIAELHVAIGGHRRKIPAARVVAGAWGTVQGRTQRQFMCLAEADALTDGARWLEVTTDSGDQARARLPAPRRADNAALRIALTHVNAPHDLDRCFDNVAGPAVMALHAACAHQRVSCETVRLGDPADSCHTSVIIPLHGRIDYLEVQMALFSAQPCMRKAQILFVVDDPPLQAEALAQARSAFTRFGLGCEVLLPSRNLGFAAASNLGLRAASGRRICFLNSDAFPDKSDWLQRLNARLDDDASLGAVGPLLLFPDGSVQHDGMVLVARDDAAGWRFPRHVGKGLRPAGTGLTYPAAITGACMVMPRNLALKLGGFDEGFVIGDFEDADLCARIVQTGLRCAVDRDVAVLHLERKSQQAEAPWRAGATLYNAWLHERRWFAASATAAPPPARRKRVSG